MITLGLDSGTQSTKCLALDIESGELLAQASAGHELIDDLPPGHAEQHPADWIAALDETVRSCLGQLGERKGDIRGIGVSGQQHGLVVLDADDRPVRPAKLWCDTSTAEQCRQFEEKFGGTEGLIERAGNAVLPGYTAPKILWLKQNEPENFARTESVLLPHDYLNFHLTGAKRMEYGDASGTGLLDVRARAWDEELVRFVDERLQDMLPELGSSRAVHGPLRSELAERWGLDPAQADRIAISAGGGDNMMGAIGTGNISPGTVTASLGTSGTLYACADDPVVDPRGEVAAFCDSTDRWLPLVCTMNVTVVTEQVRKLFGWDLAELESQVEKAPPGAGGIAFLPYLNGERTPNLPGGSGVLHGLTTGNLDPARLARAAMEGATLGLAYGLGRFSDLGLEPEEIRLTGGGSQSAAWRQIAADVFGTPVVCLASAEGAALGAALQAAHACEQGGYPELCDRFVELDESTRCRPDPERVEFYREERNRHGELTRILHDEGKI